MSDEPKRKAPAFQFYADDFLAGTSDMSAEEVGGYIRLLCHQWTKGGIPNDPDRAGRMATLLGSPSLGYVLAKFSLCDDGMLRNERLEQVRADQEAYKAKQATAGRNGALKRWSKWPDDGDPNGVAMATPMATAWPEHSQTIATPMATAWPEDSSPSPTPKEDTTTPKSPWTVKYGLTLPDKFQTDECLAAVETWLAYKAERKQGYKRIGLSAALQAWAKEYTAETFPAAVMHSIASNYQGVFPPRNALPAVSGKNLPIPTDAKDLRNYL